MLRKDCSLKLNITRKEARALKELKKGQIQGYTYSEKGVEMEILDKKDYINKAQRDTYRPLVANCINKQRMNLYKHINTLRAVYTERGIGDNTYNRL